MKSRIRSLGVYLMLSTGAALADGLGRYEYEAPLDSKSNFAEAKFACLIPDAPIKGVLFLAGGTDTDVRPWLEDRRWRSIANRERLVLIAAYMRGAGEDYEAASNGSGRALIDAVEYFQYRSGVNTLSDLPLILYGHSAGAQFAYNFACWKPERVRAIVCVKSGPLVEPSPRSLLSFPALFVVGENDTHSRVREVAKAYAVGRSRNAPWCLAVQPGAGHDAGGCNEITEAFISSLFWENGGLALSARLDATPKIEKAGAQDSNGGYSWLPDMAFARRWADFSRAVSLEALVSIPAPAVDDSKKLKWDPVRAIPELVPDTSGVVRFIYDVGLLNTHDGIRTLTPKSSNPAISVSAIRARDDQWKVVGEFDPRLEPIGVLRSEISAEIMSSAGRRVGGRCTLFTRITGPLEVVPTSVYYGVIQRGSFSKFRLEVRSEPELPVKSCYAVSSNPEFMSVLLNRSSNGKEFEATLLLNAGARVGEQHGFIMFEVEAGRKYRIRVPYYGFVRK